LITKFLQSLLSITIHGYHINHITLKSKNNMAKNSNQ